MRTNFRISKSFFLYLVIGLFFRYWNIEQRLYFTWDQGRDAWMLQNMAKGDLTLLGPTSGIPGFFLGPLWYYLGLPGYWLGGGSPLVISLWYIALGALALPIFWKISHMIFSNKQNAQFCAYALALCPSALNWGIRIWNPLLSIPLMAFGLWALLKARTSRLHLILGYLAFAFTLQSEFAYAIFFFPVLLVITPWIRRKFDMADYLTGGLAVGVTLIPQLLSEFRNNFNMYNALIVGLTDSTKSVGWTELWSTRPAQLFEHTNSLLLGGFPYSTVITWVFLLLAGVAVRHAFQQHTPRNQAFAIKLLAVLALVPYVFTMFWRGNYGHLFDYYLTPHFVFLVPLVVMGAVRIAKVLPVFRHLKLELFAFMILIFAVFAYRNVFMVENNAGYRVMTQAMERLYEWRLEDQAENAIFRFYTPGVQSEHYDYLMWYQAEKRVEPLPITVNLGTRHLYALTEPNYDAPDAYLDGWYTEDTADCTRTRKEQIGALTIESWERN